MKFFKKLFSFFILISVSYILFLFIFTKEVKNFWDNIWLKNINLFLLDLKEKSDFIIKSDIKISEIWSWANWLLDSATNYAKEIKSKVDWVRQTASWVEHTYNNVKNQVETTKKTIDDATLKMQEIKNSIENTKNILN